VPDKEEKVLPAAIHYTEGGPWFPDYRNTDYSKEWFAHMKEYEATLPKQRLLCPFGEFHPSFILAMVIPNMPLIQSEIVKAVVLKRRGCCAHFVSANAQTHHPSTLYLVPPEVKLYFFSSCGSSQPG
jgi:hypothetical protein